MSLISLIIKCFPSDAKSFLYVILVRIQICLVAKKSTGISRTRSNKAKNGGNRKAQFVRGAEVGICFVVVFAVLVEIYLTSTFASTLNQVEMTTQIYPIIGLTTASAEQAQAYIQNMALQNLLWGIGSIAVVLATAVFAMKAETPYTKGLWIAMASGSVVFAVVLISQFLYLRMINPNDIYSLLDLYVTLSGAPQLLLQAAFIAGVILVKLISKSSPAPKS